MNMRSILAVSMLAVVAFGASAQASTNLVTNGDFTSLTNGLGELGGGAATSLTTATDWTSSGYNFVFSVADQSVSSQYGANDLGLWDAANGGLSTWNGLAAVSGNFVGLDGAYLQGPLSQSITGLTVGQTYDLSFYYAFGQQSGFYGDTTQNIAWNLGTDVVGISANTLVPQQTFSGWTKVSDVFTATQATETLSFLSTASPQLPPFALLSNVSITSDVPEPATWAMFLVGFGLLGAAARRYRAKAVTA